MLIARYQFTVLHGNTKFPCKCSDVQLESLCEKLVNEDELIEVVAKTLPRLGPCGEVVEVTSQSMGM